MNKIMLIILICLLFISGCTDSENNTPATSETGDSNKQIIDCGSRGSNDASKIAGSKTSHELDDALVCFGNSLLDGCKPAKLFIYTSYVGQVTYESKNIENKCIIKTEYGNVEQIPTEEQKKYANTFSECPVDIEYLISSSDIDAFTIPGYFAYKVILMTMVQISEGSNSICTGTYMDIVME